jgi:predicted GTPase
VVLAYSDLSHGEVMARASIAMTHGADFRLIGPRAMMLHSTRPVVAVVATRTGCGKSPTSRRICRLLRDAGLRPVLVRHPMPYGDLAAMAVQRFADAADIDAAHPTVEEREEYELPVAEGFTVFAGVDYEAVLRRAEAEADVIVWDGGNNDLPFFAPDLTITVTDALRPGHELGYHPGEVNLRSADVVVVNKVDAAEPAAVAAVIATVRRVNPAAVIVTARSPVVLGPGPSLAGRRVLVIEDGPTITHGGMPHGAGLVAARGQGAEPVDPRPFAVGSLARTFADHPHIGPVLPAMGYGDAQLADLAATVGASGCDVVVSATPMDLGRLIDIGRPVRRVTYEVEEQGHPDLADVLAPLWERWLERARSRPAPAPT